MDKTKLIVFTTSPTGLGHIRVTKSLINGLPKNTPYHILGINDMAIESVYRLMSTNFLLRETMEFFQTNETAEKLQTNFFTFYERKNVQKTLAELKELIAKNPQAEEIIIVSTHAQLGRRVQSILDDNLLPIPAFHAVIVTDDSPQRLWAVCAPMVIVPSEHTKNELSKLFVCDRLHHGEIHATPYPIDPKLTQELTRTQMLNRLKQCEPGSQKENEPLQICVPISGAAVQLDFFESIISHFHDHPLAYKKIHFHIVAKDSPYSESFLRNMRTYPIVTIHAGKTNEETVDLYSHLYCSSHFPPAVEITKPSEQAFKVLTPPNTRGGSMLLLTKPVGRQEYDNLDYLKRELYIPSRALELADTPEEAIQQITNLVESRTLYKLMSEQTKNQNNGVAQMWQLIFERSKLLLT